MSVFVSPVVWSRMASSRFLRVHSPPTRSFDECESLKKSLSHHTSGNAKAVLELHAPESQLDLKEHTISV